jgi:lincosamide nucleotidyltransferase A/C/D/E
MNPDMTVDALLSLLQLFELATLETWLDGGWGVDALLGEQTRPHKDVDLLVGVTDLPKLDGLLGSRGFARRPDGTPSNYVLADSHGVEVDIHAIEFDSRGDGLYRMSDGNIWVYPAAGFSGRGMVGGVEVRCLSPEAQVVCHAHGYVPVEKDLRDMALLQARFAVALPPQLRPAQG